MYVTLGALSASFWSDAKAKANAALNELQDAADGVFGAGARPQWLDWLKNTARPLLASAIAEENTNKLKQLQSEVLRARDALPTAVVWRINPFTNLSIPQAPAASGGRAPSGGSSGSAPSVPPMADLYPQKSPLGMYLALGGIGALSVALFLRRKNKR